MADYYWLFSSQRSCGWYPVKQAAVQTGLILGFGSSSGRSFLMGSEDETKVFHQIWLLNGYAAYRCRVVVSGGLVLATYTNNALTGLSFMIFQVRMIGWVCLSLH